MDVYFLRHGEAGKRMAALTRDHERALTAAGKKEIEGIGESLRSAGFEFDLVAASPLRRAKETASLVNNALRRKRDVEEWPELSPNGNREVLYRRIAKIKEGSSVLCVGHEPYLTLAIGGMITRGGDESTFPRIALKKGGLAKVSVTGFTPRVSGELRWLLTPKQVKRLGNG